MGRRRRGRNRTALISPGLTRFVAIYVENLRNLGITLRRIIFVALKGNENAERTIMQDRCILQCLQVADNVADRAQLLIGDPNSRCVIVTDI